ncbi:hypothetical protein H6F43_07650, partial [Leptolyngbya sp. FACHB-36]|uniref:Calx-beta domain-containing protein n=1 Tax=Leptolyngbya sp. FACHB-36 TaxID=2692808 RepID=UPI0019B2F1DA
VSLTATDATATELPGNPGTYRISRDGNSGNLTVNLTITSASTASATDYTLSSAPSGSNLTVTIPNGQSFVDVTLTPVLDALVESTETATLNLASGSYGINPAQTTATVNIEDAPVVSLSIPDNIVNEHIPNSGSFRITRTGATAQALTVNYTIAGTATNSIDYTTLTGTATIAVGQASVDVVINPTNDTIDELDEIIQITLAAGSYVTTSPSNTGSLTISANDPTVSITPINASQVEGDAGTSAYSFLVSLSHISDETVTVDYQTADGSATVVDSDYIAVTPTTLTFNPGTTQQTIAIPVRGDAQFETDETFGVALSNVTKGSISAAVGTAIGTIANDDGVSSYAFSSAQFFAAEGNATNTSQVVVITRSGNINIASTIDVLLTPGTASAGIDFVAGTVRLSFAVGQTVIVVPIDLFSDTRSEGDETIGLTLLNPSFGSVVGTQAQATLTLVNDDLLPVYDFAASNFRVSEGNGSNTVWLPVTRSGNLFRASFVQVQVYSGSGIAERDFVGGVIAVYFAEGQSTGWLPIQILGNSEYEADKVFTLSFVGFSEEGSYGSQTQASVTIVNDDTLFRRGGGRSGYRG